MIYISLTTILLLYFAFAFMFTPFIKRHFKIKICAICAAVSLTWVSLLTLRALNVYEIDPAIIATLLGGSVVGILYQLENTFKEKQYRKFWIIRIFIITGGFHLAYMLATENEFGIISGLIVLLLVFIITIRIMFWNKKKAKKQVKKKKPEKKLDQDKKAAIKKLEESLEDCC